ncbi:hypothetical protein [Cellvibrio sp. PSBB023]|uniref:hypothetical protein n=1 Tax=Cellvibrio sp. PSBB023 TaxID=1945512 RepID=UPI00122DC825|nr:hypothetical protein [Cellvibrio sp. PSBB023]
MIQRLINENIGSIPKEALAGLIAKLNTGNIESLHTVWELVVINLLSKNGTVNYEANHGGTSRPDIHFKSCEFEMVSDVTCISDQDSINNNDIDYFIKEFLAVAQKSGIHTLAGFNFQFDGSHEWRKKVKLKLPTKQNTRKFIESKFKSFILDVSQQPRVRQQIKITDNDVVISADYTPDKETFSMGYPVFTQAPTHQNNVLYNRLNTKRDQLKKSGFNGVKGVFICDADCAIFGKKKDEYSSYGMTSIINNFLRGQETISFVFMLHVAERSENIFLPDVSRNFELNVFSKQACHPEIVNLAKRLNESIKEFSKPERNAKNALNRLKAGKSIPGSDFYGGYKMTEKTIRVSLRTVLRLISGELTHEEFLRDHGNMGHFLLNKIISGRPLESLNIIKEKDRDDDWLEFSFGENLDPAVNRYLLSGLD